MIKVIPSRLSAVEQYADAVHELAFSVSDMKQRKISTIFDDVDLFDECLSIEDEVSKIYTNFDNVDTSAVEVGHYYKSLQTKHCYSWGLYEIYLYKVLEVDETKNTMKVDTIRVCVNGVYHDDTMCQSDFTNLKYFAGRLNKGEIIEITEDEFNEAMTANELFNKLYRKSGGFKYEQYNLD